MWFSALYNVNDLFYITLKRQCDGSTACDVDQLVLTCLDCSGGILSAPRRRRTSVWTRPFIPLGVVNDPVLA